jgi:hypothetical protein
MCDESIDMDSKLMSRIGIGAAASMVHDLADRSVSDKLVGLRVGAEDG